MHCNTVRATLLDHLNSETGPVRAWAIRRHLAACADCAQELAALHQFTATLRRADLVPPLSAPVAVPARRVPPRRAVAAMAAVLLVVGLFLLPTLYQSRRNAQNPGAAIAAALGRVNTWHFAGWKLIDGKQVPWEVWGRRSPWLYYERVGDTTTWSDGKQRLRVFAPNPALKRPEGLIIKTSVNQVSGDPGFLVDPAYQSFVNDQRVRTGFGDAATRLDAQTPTVVRFRRQDSAGASSGVDANKLYTVSKRDWLPTLYQRHFDTRTFTRDTEYLEVRYDVDLPDSVVSPPSPRGYSVVDLTQPANQRADLGSHTSGSRSFRIQAEPVGMDKRGNILIVARGWLGGSRLVPGSALSLDVLSFASAVSGERRDAQAKYIWATGSSTLPDGDISLPYTPLEPSQVAGSRPDTFHLTLYSSLQVRVRPSDLIDAAGKAQPQTQTVSLVWEPLHWTLPLPFRPVSSLLALLPPDQRDGFQASSALPPGARRRFPLQAAEYNLAEQRRANYFTGADYLYTGLTRAAPQLARTGVLTPEGLLNPDVEWLAKDDGLAKVEAVRQRYPVIFKEAEQEFRAHTVYWQKRKLELLPTGGATPGERFVLRQRRIVELQLLADCYRKAGNKADQDRTLRQLIRESRAKPEFAGFRRQAEYSLDTGSFPGDADYKGPS